MPIAMDNGIKIFHMLTMELTLVTLANCLVLNQVKNSIIPKATIKPEPDKTTPVAFWRTKSGNQKPKYWIADCASKGR